MLNSPGPPVFRRLLVHLALVMFCKTSLVAVALALLASANPIIRENGVTIPLRKRASLTKADGTFDHEKANILTAKTIK